VLTDDAELETTSSVGKRPHAAVGSRPSCRDIHDTNTTPVPRERRRCRLSFLPGWLPFVGGDSDDTESTDDRSPTLAEREDQYGMTIDYPEGGSRNTDRRLSPIATQCSSQWDCTHRVQYDDSEYQYAYYWHKLTHQQGILFDADSHLGDHEPTIVRVDSDGVIDRVTYTFYHHLADSISGARLTRALRARETAEPTHVQLRIVPPWHNYAVVEGTPSQPVSFRDVQGDADASHLRTWETQGIFDPTADEAVWSPRTVQDRGSWWDESTTDYQAAQLYLRARPVHRHCGLRGNRSLIRT